VRPNRFEYFATAIRGLPPGRLSRERLLDGEFLLAREGHRTARQNHRHADLPGDLYGGLEDRALPKLSQTERFARSPESTRRR
jgi:hypothetical protein